MEGAQPEREISRDVRQRHLARVRQGEGPPGRGRGQQRCPPNRRDPHDDDRDRQPGERIEAAPESKPAKSHPNRGAYPFREAPHLLVGESLVTGGSHAEGLYFPWRGATNRGRGQSPRGDRLTTAGGRST